GRRCHPHPAHGGYLDRLPGAGADNEPRLLTQKKHCEAHAVALRSAALALFLWAFARTPTAQQRDIALAHIGKHAANKMQAYENILWAPINTAATSCATRR